MALVFFNKLESLSGLRKIVVGYGSLMPPAAVLGFFPTEVYL